jgi:hypothetical protein
LRQQSCLARCGQKQQTPGSFAVSWLNRDAFGLFFSHRGFAGQSQARSDSVELTDAHRQREMLLDSILQRRTGQVRAGLTALAQECEDFPSQFDGMTMSPIDHGSFFVVLHALEQAVNGGTMDRHSACTSRLLH